MATSPTFAKRRVYWSQLREASPVTIVLLDQPRDSKFADRLPYVRFRVEGEDAEHELQIESEAARHTLEKRVRVDQPTTVAAAGKGEHAVLEVISDAPKTDTRVTPRAQRQQRSAEIAASQPSTPDAGGSLARSYFDALEVAVQVVAAFKERHKREPTECERAVACSLWIEQNRGGGRRPLRQGRGGAQ
jgi:hypothetical protein